MEKTIHATEHNSERIPILSIPKRYQVIYSIVLTLSTIVYTYYVTKYGDFSEITNPCGKTIVIIDHLSRFIPVAIWAVFIYETIGGLSMLLANFFKQQIIQEREQRENMIREETRQKTIEHLFVELEKKGINTENISIDDFLNDNNESKTGKE